MVRGNGALVVAGVFEDPRYQEISRESLQLLGAYSTRQYATEGAALTNPSIIFHPDQTGLSLGQTRVALSLRAVGEGHLSSIVFVTVILDSRFNPILVTRVSPQMVGELSFPNQGEPATLDSKRKVNSLDDYQISFPASSDLSQRVLYPSGPREAMGMEDARFVEMHMEDGETNNKIIEYWATYTAYDGRSITPRLIVTRDLVDFRIMELTGPAAVNKGMAIFPEKINGLFKALCRGDGYSSSLAESKDGIHWSNALPLTYEDSPWDLLITGNAGSPHLTEAGWVVVTHGVGPLRTYSLGAILLDKNDPTKVIGYLKTPLLAPEEGESFGYVPNVLYSCGSLMVHDTLWIPYGTSDRATAFASVNVKALIKELLAK